MKRSRKSWKKFLWKKRCLIRRMEESGRSGSEIDAAVKALETRDWFLHGSKYTPEPEPEERLAQLPTKKKDKGKFSKLMLKCMRYSVSRDREIETYLEEKS